MSWSARRGLALLALVWAGSAAADQRVEWLLARGLPYPMLEWAPRYEHGEGVAQDIPAAIRLYCAAAVQHRKPEAMYALGWIYANGRGVARDDALAAAWFREADRYGCSVSGYLYTLLRTEIAAPKSGRTHCVLREPASAAADLSRDIPRRQHPQTTMLLTARLLDFDDLSAEEADFLSNIREGQRRAEADERRFGVDGKM